MRLVVPSPIWRRRRTESADWETKLVKRVKLVVASGMERVSMVVQFVLVWEVEVSMASWMSLPASAPWARA